MLSVTPQQTKFAADVHLAEGEVLYGKPKLNKWKALRFCVRKQRRLQEKEGTIIFTLRETLIRTLH